MFLNYDMFFISLFCLAICDMITTHIGLNYCGCYEGNYILKGVKNIKWNFIHTIFVLFLYAFFWYIIKINYFNISTTWIFLLVIINILVQFNNLNIILTELKREN